MPIRQFDAFVNPVRSARAAKPFLMRIQHHHLDHLSTRLVAPLLPHVRGELTRLNPIFTIEGQRVFLDPTNLSAIRAEYLRNPVVNLDPERYRIVSALDLVFSGV